MLEMLQIWNKNKFLQNFKCENLLSLNLTDIMNESPLKLVKSYYQDKSADDLIVITKHSDSCRRLIYYLTKTFTKFKNNQKQKPVKSPGNDLWVVSTRPLFVRSPFEQLIQAIVRRNLWISIHEATRWFTCSDKNLWTANFFFHLFGRRLSLFGQELIIAVGQKICDGPVLVSHSSDSSMEIPLW